jgi:hypothetical protein
MESCKAKSGMCGHEKIMGLLVLVVAVIFVARHFIY